MVILFVFSIQGTNRRGLFKCFSFNQNKLTVNSTKHSKKETCIQNKREINKTLNKNLLGSVSRLSLFGCLETNNEQKKICWCQAG